MSNRFLKGTDFHARIQEMLHNTSYGDIDLDAPSELVAERTEHAVAEMQKIYIENMDNQDYLVMLLKYNVPVRAVTLRAAQHKVSNVVFALLVNHS